MINLITTKEHNLDSDNNVLSFDDISIHTGKNHAAEDFNKETGDISLTTKYAIYSINFSANIYGPGAEARKAELGIRINNDILPFSVMEADIWNGCRRNVACTFPYKNFTPPAKVEIVSLNNEKVIIGKGTNLYIRRIA